MTKLYCFLIASLASISSSWAQNTEWATPHVGYSSTDMLNVDKVEFKKSATVMHVTASGREGTTFWIAPTASLKAGNQKYAVKKVPKVGIDKKCTIPKGGKVHFTMHFDPLPQGTEVMHFTESDGDEGWHLCNIRNGEKDLATSLPAEWENVVYEDLEELPESRFCDDSTTVRVQILNYVPEAGRTLTVTFTPIGFDMEDVYKTYDITADGTSAFKLHPCFPMTVEMRIGSGKTFPLLIMPGKECDVLMDMEKGGGDAAVAFQGALAKVNYELNVLGGKNSIRFDAGSAHADSLLNTGKDIGEALLEQLRSFCENMPYNKFSRPTLEWMEMNAERLHDNAMMESDSYVRGKIKNELVEANSSILKNHRMWSKVSAALTLPRDAAAYYHFPHSTKMTYCPRFTEMWAVAGVRFSESHYDDAPYNRDIYNLHQACMLNETESYEEGLKLTRAIADPELKAFYTLNAERWQAFVDSINRVPHLHFDQHGRTLDRKKLKDKLLEEYRGRNVMFMVYNRDAKGVTEALQDMDSLIAKTDSRKIVFIHIDTNALSAREWLQSAHRWHGEHYGGKRTRYDSMFYGVQDITDPGILYELHSPDGTITLSTKDKQEALDVIRKLMKE